MALKCVLWDRECIGCQNCRESDSFIDAYCFDLTGDYLDFIDLDGLIHKEVTYEQDFFAKLSRFTAGN